MDSNFAFIGTCLPGATINRIVKKAVKILAENNTFSLVIILGGIDDITKLASRPLWLVKTRFDNITATVDYVGNEIKTGSEILQASTQIPVVFCPVVGLNLSVYSPMNADAENQQVIIDQAVKRINQYIYSLNAEKYIPTPLLESTIHKC